jgi:hypothetical protein
MLIGEQGSSMTRKKSEPEMHVHDLSKLKGQLKAIGGSMCDDWNNMIANQAIRTIWSRRMDDEEAKKQRHATVNALIDISPRDVFEGMIAAQMIACHNASMECYRRAMLSEQTKAVATI